MHITLEFNQILFQKCSVWSVLIHSIFPWLRNSILSRCMTTEAMSYRMLNNHIWFPWLAKRMVYILVIPLFGNPLYYPKISDDSFLQVATLFVWAQNAWYKYLHIRNTRFLFIRGENLFTIHPRYLFVLMEEVLKEKGNLSESMKRWLSSYILSDRISSIIFYFVCVFLCV